MSDFKANMHQIRFRLGLRPRPRWGSLQRSPDPLAGLEGPTSKWSRGEGRGGQGKEGKGKEEGGEGFDPPQLKFDKSSRAGHNNMPIKNG